MKISFRLFLFSCSIIFFHLFITAGPGKTQTAPTIGLHENTPDVIAFNHGRIHIAPGNVLENATLLIRNGRVEAVGVDLKIPSDAVIRDVTGKTIYSGFIDLFSQYGMLQKQSSTPESGSSGSSQNRKGARHWNPAIQPERSAAMEFIPDEKTANELRQIGFTTVLTLPPEGILRGMGCLVLLSDGLANQAVLAPDLVQAMSFSTGRSLPGRGVLGYPGSQMGSIALIRQTFLDAQWYRQAWIKYNQAAAGLPTPEVNLALEAIIPFVSGQKPIVMELSDELDILRAAKIAREFGLQELWLVGSGSEYRRLAAVKNTGLKLIVPIDFPDPPNLSSPEEELNVELRELLHWDRSPENPGILARAGVDFALTTASLKNKGDFLTNLRLAVKRGLTAEGALRALTITPAEWLKMSNILATLERGKLANFIITDGDLCAEKTKIIETWIKGIRYDITKLPALNPFGTWSIDIQTKTKLDTGTLVISGEISNLKANLTLEGTKVPIAKINQEDQKLHLSFAGDSSGYKGVARMTGWIEEKLLHGHGRWGDDSKFTWQAKNIRLCEEKPDTTKPEPVKMAEFPVVYPDGAFGRTSAPMQPDVLLVKNATIWTCGPDAVLTNADLMVKNGKILKAGKNLTAPAGAIIIEAIGKHVTPGIVDAHSHLAISGGINEGTHAVTAEVRIEDVIDCDDSNIYRQLAGGVTTACILHGSSNPIGGQNAVIKLRWGELPDQLLVTAAQPGIKFALGENVKQSDYTGQSPPRYPGTRMGVEQIIRDAFEAAKDYQHEWQVFTQQHQKNKNLIPPRRDLRLEALGEVLDGNRIIHCHSYRQDEILALIRLAEAIGIKVNVFIHALEGYKVAEEMQRHGTMATTFSDWWAYKFEAYDAIPYNGAVMHNQGIVVSYNSDSNELARRLNSEAAKAVKYGLVAPEEALKFVTLNAAKQLYIDHCTGSLEPGKDADFVIWNGPPLSTYSRCEQTWIDGRKYFDIDEDKELRDRVRLQRATLVQKILGKKGEKKDGRTTGGKSE